MSCNIIATILGPTILLVPLPGKHQSIGDCCFSSIFHYNLLLSSLFHFHYAISFMQKQIRISRFHRLAFQFHNFISASVDQHFNSAISILQAQLSISFLQFQFCKRSLAFQSYNFISVTQISPLLLSFQFCIFISARQILVRCSSIYFSFAGTSEKIKKIK